MFRDELYILGKEEFMRKNGAESESFVEELETPIRRIDLPESGGPVEQRRTDDLDRRESVLSARIAQFEALVRKTKLTIAEKMDKINRIEEASTSKLTDFSRRESSLAVREAELTRREEEFRARADEFAASETKFLDRLETLSAHEEELTRTEAEFQNRSERILRQIAEQKRELERLLGRIS